MMDKHISGHENKDHIEYESMLDAICDAELQQEAMRRIAAGGETLTMEEMMESFGITEEALGNVQVEIE